MKDKEELYKQSVQLKNDGEKLLLETGIVKYLQKYGTVNIHGGYRYGLLLKPDIDVHLISKDCGKQVAETTVCHFINEDKFSQVLYCDHEKHHAAILEATGRDHLFGQYIGLNYFYDGLMWNIDIFILPEEQPEIAGLIKYFDNECSETTRKEILLSKLYLYENKISFPAKKMYDLFIAREFGTATEFAEYLKNEKV